MLIYRQKGYRLNIVIYYENKIINVTAQYICNEKTMPFKKGTSGNPICRPKGSVSTTSKLIREHISQAFDGNKSNSSE